MKGRRGHSTAHELSSKVPMHCSPTSCTSNFCLPIQTSVKCRDSGFHPFVLCLQATLTFDLGGLPYELQAQVFQQLLHGGHLRAALALACTCKALRSLLLGLPTEQLRPLASRSCNVVGELVQRGEASPAFLMETLWGLLEPAPGTPLPLRAARAVACTLVTALLQNRQPGPLPFMEAALWAAVRQGHVEVVRALLPWAGPLLRVIGQCQGQNLVAAATHGHVEVCRLLLGYASSNGMLEGMLFAAAEHGQLEVVGLLLQQGCMWGSPR